MGSKKGNVKIRRRVCEPADSRSQLRAEAAGWRASCSVQRRRSTIMKRAAVISLCLVSVALIVACNRHDEQADTSKKSIVDLAIHPPAPVVPTPVVVTGCLMGAGTEFIISTPDRSQEGSNIVYELTNAGDQLIVLVGQKVRVTGEAEPIQVAEVR